MFDSKKLMALRKGARLTQMQLAEILGIDNTTISSYETGRSVPDSDIQLRIKNYFDITLDELHVQPERAAFAYPGQNARVRRLTPVAKNGDERAAPREKRERLTIRLPRNVNPDYVNDLKRFLQLLSYEYPYDYRIEE